MKEVLKVMRCQDRGVSDGRMAKVMKVNGERMLCMAEVSFSGWMAGRTKGSMSTMRSQVMEFFAGQMADVTRVNGLAGSSMAMGLTSRRMATSMWVAGRMDRGSVEYIRLVSCRNQALVLAIKMSYLAQSDNVNAV